MGLAILGVVVLLYILLAYFAAKTWQAWHVVLLVFAFLGTLGMLILAAATLKVQDKWRGRYEGLVADIASAEQQNLRLSRGSILDDELGETALRGEVQRTVTDRGRLWRNLRLVQAEQGQITLDATGWGDAGCRALGEAEEDFDEPPVDEDGDAPAAAPTTLGLDADAVVFAFKETPVAALPADWLPLLLGESDLAERDTRGRCKVPTFYMGEFKVVGNPDDTPGAVTIAPAMTLNERQLQALEEQDSTWVLYETMPVDAHNVFEGLSAEQLASLMARGASEGIDWQPIFKQYVRDGQEGNDTDPPGEKVTRVRFLQPHTEEVDVAVEGDVGQQPMPDRLFDLSGRSLVTTLNQGKPTEFQPGDEAVFDFATADELRSAGKVEFVQQIYARPLRDYSVAFQSISARADELQREVSAAQEDLDKLAKALEDLNRQNEFQTGQRDDLQHDRDGLANELQVLAAYRQSLEAKWTQLRQELSRLYRSNRQLVSSMSPR